MMTLEELQAAYQTMHMNHIREQAQYDALSKDCTDLQQNIQTCKDTVLTYEIAAKVFDKTGEQTREYARVHFEQIVTNALQFITQDASIQFVIEDLKRTKPSYEFYIKKYVNGEESLELPEDAGGGIVDIVSSAARFVYKEIFGDPKIMNHCMIYDEPGKMISEQLLVKFAEYLKFLGKKYDNQTIMVTHASNLKAIADKLFLCIHNGSGSSKIYDSSCDDIDLNLLESMISNKLKGEEQNV